MAATSKTDTQRRDALAYLTTQISSQPVNASLPLPTSILLPKLLPLILDGTSSVRTNLLKLFRLLPSHDVADRAEAVLLYVRAGMTHLASEIRLDALSVLEWLCDAAGEEAVACPGGWVKTLKAFMSMLGWQIGGGVSKWSLASKVAFGNTGKVLNFPKQVLVLSRFLRLGLMDGSLADEDSLKQSGGDSDFPLRDAERHRLPTRANAYAHLNLFGTQRDEEGEMYIDREDRQRVFAKRFLEATMKGCENAKREAGEAGRAAAVLGKVLREGLKDYGGVENTLVTGSK